MSFHVVNFFIAQSPLQLLSAIEAAHHFSGDCNVLIVRYTREHSTNTQIGEILKLYAGWSGVFEIKCRRSLIMSGLELISLVKKLNNKNINVCRVFLGDYRSWYVPYLLGDKKKTDYYLLDDGNATIDLQKNYLPVSKLYFGFGIKSVFRRLSGYLLTYGLIREKKIIHLFTSFNLRPFSTEQIIIQHNFQYFRARSAEKIIDRSLVFFFGGPISELNLLPFTREMELLAYISRGYKKKNIKLVYIPHRRDSREKIKYIQDVIKLEIIHFKYCAELEIIHRKRMPIGIASFCSTALYTLPKIFNFEFIDSYRLPISEMPEFHHIGMEAVYKEYEKVMRVINL